MAKLEGVKIIDAKGGVIEKISYDGAEYIAEKVPLNEFAVGDIAWFDDYEFKQIERIESRHNGAHFWFDGGYMSVTSSENKLIKTRFRKVVTYNVGDIVVITSAVGGTYNKVGDIGKIIDSKNEEFRVEVPSVTSPINWSFAKGLRHATPAEIAEYEKAAAPKVEIKAGDFVKNTGDDGRDLTIGKVYEVLKVDVDGDFVIFDDVHDRNLLESHNCEKAERPYEVGDIVRVVGDNGGHRIGTIGEIVRIFRSDCVVVSAIREGTEISFNENDIELVAPVSARKDRK